MGLCGFHVEHCGFMWVLRHLRVVLRGFGSFRGLITVLSVGRMSNSKLSKILMIRNEYYESRI